MTDSIGTEQDVIIFGREFNREKDEAFVFSTWRNGLWYGHVNKAELPPAADFFRLQTEKIKRILDAPGTHVRIACIKDAPEVILGYAVFVPDLHLEWIFVKFQFRAKGIGNFLTVRMKSVSLPQTKPAAAIVKKKGLIIKRSMYETEF